MNRVYSGWFPLRMRCVDIAVAALVFAALQASPARVFAQTQSGTWTLVGSSTWGNTAAWSGGLVAGGTNNTASVTVAGTAALTSNIILGNLTTSSGRVQIVGLDASPSAYQLRFVTTTGTAPTITNAGRLDMRPTITGTQGFRKAGTGDMFLWQTNTYTGTTTLTAGRVRLQNGGGLGSTADGTVVLPAATLMLDAAGLVTTAEPLFISGTGHLNQGSLRLQTGDGEYAGPIIATGSANITVNTGLTLTLSNTINPNGNYLLMGDGGNHNITGGFVGTSGTVNFGGTGLITLSGSSSFTGVTQVGNATGLVTMTGYMAGLMDFSPGGARTLAGTGTFAGGLSTGQNATLAPGASDASTEYGTLTTTTLNLVNGSVILGIQDATTYDRIVMTAGSGGLTLGGANKPQLTLDFSNVSASLPAGTLNLLSFNGVSGTWANVSSTGFYAGPWSKSGSTWSASGGSGGAVGSGTISSGTTLAFVETTGVLTIAPLPLSVLYSGTTITDTIVIGSAGGQVGINSAGSTTFSGPVTVGGTATLSAVAGGTATFTSAISGNTGAVDKTGPGTVIVTAANTYTVPTTVTAGSLQLGTGGTVGSLSASSAISIASGATFVVNRSNAVTQGTDFGSSALTGAGGFTQAGLGTTTLTAANAYTGATNVDAGALLVNGNQSGATGAVTVASGATLGGSGTIGGAVTVNGILSPGNSPGVLTAASVVLGASSTSFFEINGTTRGTQYDGVDITNASGLTYGGALSLSFGNLSAFATNTTFDLFNFTGTPSSNFSSVTSTGFYAGTWTLASGTWSLDSQGQKLSFTPLTGDLVIAVPEPSTIAMLGASVAVASLMRWRRRKGRAILAAALAIGMVACAQSAFAQSGTWNASAGTTLPWSGTSNWSGGTVADGSGNTATFRSTGTTTLDTNRTIGTISSGSGFRVISGTGTLTLATGVGTPTLTGTVNSGTLAIAAPIAGTQGFQKTGTSTTLALAVANTFSGTSLIQTGTVTITNVDALGATGAGNETVVASGAQLRITLSGTVAESFTVAGRGSPTNSTSYSGRGAIRAQSNAFATLTGGITLSGTTELAADGSSQLTLAGPTSGTGDLFFTAGSGNGIIVSGNMSHVGSLTRVSAGSATLTLSGSNSYTGSTAVDNGVMRLGSAYAIPTTSRLSVTGGDVKCLDLNGYDITIPTFGWREDGVNAPNQNNSSGGQIYDDSNSAGTSTITVTTGSFVLGTAINDGFYGRKVALRVAAGDMANIELINATSTFSGGLTLLNGSGRGTRLNVNDPLTNGGSAGAITSSIFGTGTVTVGLAPTDKAQFYMGPNTVTAGVGSTVLNDMLFNTAAGTDSPSGVLLNATEAIFAGKLVAGQAPVSFATGAIVTNSVAVLTGRVTSTGTSGGLRLVGNGQIPGITVRLNNQTGTPNDYQGTTAIEGNTTLVLGAADQVPNGAGMGNVSISTSGTFNLNGFSDTINGLTGSGGVDGSSGTPTLTVGDGDATASFSGVIRNAAGTLSFTKIGSGVQTLSGANTYSGSTSVNAGTLLVNGNQSGATGAVTVASGATLGGSGTIGGAVTVNGILSPGNSPGVLTVPSLSLGASSTAIFEINTTARGTGYDGVNISGASGPAYGGALSLVFGNVSAFGANTIFDLFNFSGSPSSNFTSVASTGFYSGTWSLDGDAWLLVSGTQTLSFTPANGDLTVTATVPEPATIALLVGLALGWRFVRGRRRSSQGTSRGPETG